MASPVIEITSPRPYNQILGNTVKGPDVQFQGTVSASTNYTLEYNVDSSSWVQFNPAAEWSTNITMSAGMHNISFRATDESGLSSYANITVNVVIPDSTPPAPITGLTAETGNTSGEVVLRWDSWDKYDYTNGTERPDADRAYIVVYIYHGKERPTDIEQMEIYEKYLNLSDWKDQSQHLPYITSISVHNLKNGERYWFAVVTVDSWGNMNTTLVEGQNLAYGQAHAPPGAGSLLSSLCITGALIVFVALGLFYLAPGRHLKKLKEKYRDTMRPYMYVAPAIIALLSLTFYPVTYGFYLSMTNSSGAHLYDYSFIGLSNYIDIFSSNLDQLISITIWTLVWTITNVTLHVTLGLLFALILNRKIRGKTMYRTLLILPWAIPAYISCLIWKGMFNYKFGAINHFLTLFGIEAIPWLTKTPYAYFAVIITNVWLGFPFMMLTFLGGLQSIPKDLYEAAEIDGVSKWDQFRHITLPLLKPTLIPVSTLGFIWTFNMFNVIYLVTGGGPAGATDILITYVYKQAFVYPFRFGFAAAYSVIIFFMLVGFTKVFDVINRGSEQ